MVTALTPNGSNYTAEISELELQAEALQSSQMSHLIEED